MTVGPDSWPPEQVPIQLSRSCRQERLGDKRRCDFQIFEAELTMESGDHDTARHLLNQSLTYFRQHDLRLYMRSWALQLQADIEHREGDNALACALLLEVIELKSTHGLTALWHSGSTILARVLLAINQAELAQRVIAEFRNNGRRSGVDPIHLQRLAEADAAAQSHLSGTETEQDERPLMDAVRQALEDHTR